MKMYLLVKIDMTVELDMLQEEILLYQKQEQTQLNQLLCKELCMVEWSGIRSRDKSQKKTVELDFW